MRRYPAVSGAIARAGGRLVGRFGDDAALYAPFTPLRTLGGLIRQPGDEPAGNRFFISYFGGLAIDDPSYTFDAFGYSPKATARYDIPMDGDQSLYEHGWLAIGALSLTDEGQPHCGQLVHFFLDLTGDIGRGCVIAIPTWDCYERIRDPRVILRDMAAHTECWTKVAASFTDWLEAAARTRGAFDYIRSKTAA